MRFSQPIYGLTRSPDILLDFTSPLDAVVTVPLTTSYPTGSIEA